MTEIRSPHGNQIIAGERVIPPQSDVTQARPDLIQSLMVNEYGAIHVPQAFVLNMSKGGHDVKIQDNLRNA